MNTITNYSALANSCLYKGYYTRGNIWAFDPDQDAWVTVAKGVRIFTSMARPHVGSWDPYPSKAEQRRDRMAKPVRVRRWDSSNVNDWYLPNKGK